MDSFDKTGATRLASKIAVYWALRGVHGIQTWIRTVPEMPGLYEVRSNVAEKMNVNSNRHAKV